VLTCFAQSQAREAAHCNWSSRTKDTYWWRQESNRRHCQKKRCWIHCQS